MERKVGPGLVFGQLTMPPGPHVRLVTGTWIAQHGVRQSAAPSRKQAVPIRCLLRVRILIYYSVMLPERVNGAPDSGLFSYNSAFSRTSLNAISLPRSVRVKQDQRPRFYDHCHCPLRIMHLAMRSMRSENTCHTIN